MDDEDKDSGETFYFHLYEARGAQIGDDRATGTILNREDEAPGDSASGADTDREPAEGDAAEDDPVEDDPAEDDPAEDDPAEEDRGRG